MDAARIFAPIFSELKCVSSGADAGVLQAASATVWFA